MSDYQRWLRTALIAFALAGAALFGAAWTADATVIAGSSGQPGEVDVGSLPTTTTADLIAGSSGQPGEVDVG